MTYSTLQIAYIAGIVDGEGCIRIKKTTPDIGRVTPGYSASLVVKMVDREAVTLLKEFFGGCLYKEKPSVEKGNPLFCYGVSDNKALFAIKSILPYLLIKKDQARKVLVLGRLKKRSNKHRTKITGYRNFPNRFGTERMVPNLALSDEFVSWCEKLFQECKNLKRF